MIKVFMVVTADKYELPIFWGTGREVAKYLGITEGTIYTTVYLKKNGGRLGRKIVKVEIDE